MKNYASVRATLISGWSSEVAGYPSGAMPERILLVDDEPDLIELLRVNLDQAGYTVDSAEDGRAALVSIRRNPPDLLILDLMLPDVSGSEICRRVRADPQLSGIPIIMLTAKADEVDRVVGLELGADDYVTKPFSPREMTLRVRAVLRRQKSAGPSLRILTHDSLSIDSERHRCTVDGKEIALTSKEFDLIRNLMERPGRVMTRERLLEEVWGSDVVVTSRTIDTHMKRLREKLGSAGSAIETIRGVGYRFRE
jgi:two-component system, OmpR family, phosphate regulon response regulator PhoB